MTRPERPARLRRAAAFIEDQAHRSRSPERARLLARRFRLRASLLEAGAELSDDEETTRLMAEMAGA